MDKLMLTAQQLDGTTPVDQAPEFRLVNGWQQAALPAAAGVIPGHLWGKVPGGDPYLLHVSVLTTNPLSATSAGHRASTACAIAAPALPAPITTVRPRGGWGKQSFNVCRG